MTCGTIRPEGSRCGAETLYGRCPACHAAYMRNYRRTVASRAVRQARRDGVRLMQLTAIQVLEGIGAMEITGLAAAEILRKVVVD